MKTLLILITVMVVSIIIYFFRCLGNKTTKLRRNLKVGDYCRFFVGYEKLDGKVKKIDGNNIIVTSFGSDYLLRKKDLYY